jgi:hypothetical protein
LKVPYQPCEARFIIEYNAKVQIDLSKFNKEDQKQ